jgi:hypothetical protein
MITHGQPVRRTEDNELMGFVRPLGAAWEACTVFGYPFAKAPSEQAAAGLVREQGLAILTELWRYFDGDDETWHPGLIQEAAPDRVTVVRASEYGLPDPDVRKTVLLEGRSASRRLKRW